MTFTEQQNVVFNSCNVTAKVDDKAVRHGARLITFHRYRRLHHHNVIEIHFYTASCYGVSPFAIRHGDGQMTLIVIDALSYILIAYVVKVQLKRKRHSLTKHSDYTW